MRKILWPLVSRICNADSIFQIQGGLGNQMFQYAFALAYEKKHKIKLALDYQECASQHNGWEVEKIFQLPTPLSILEEKFRRPIRIYQKRSGLILTEGLDVRYQPSIVENVHRGIIRGYFPSYKYFRACEETVRENFIFRNTSDINNILKNKIINSQSVAIHVRRGDYLATSNANFFSGICTNAYYTKAIDTMKQWLPEARFFVFSDDPQWCRQIFQGNEFHIVEGHDATDAWKDMYFMSLCRHSIIANSSFSWWGMWLGKQTDRRCIGPNLLANPGLVETQIEDFLPKHVTRISPSGSIVHSAIGAD